MGIPLNPAPYLSAAAGRAAAALVESRLSGRQFEGLAEEVRPRSTLDGYRVQGAVHALLREAGSGRQGGWKIGCTTPVMQAYLGVDGPTAGAMFLANMWRADHRFTVRSPRILGVECEIAVRVGADLLRRESGYTTEEVAGAVAAAMAAIEVVEDRYADYRSLDTPTLIADDFFHYGCVLGPEVESVDPRALSAVTGTMTVNDVVVGRGVGSDILGDPLEGLAWLANTCVMLGTPLLAGDVVLLGSMVQTHWVEPGDVVVAHNDPLGEVGASFAAWT
jgi:2-keto-4-pentenoate hydratase